jgi:hypothetical protein
MHAEMKTPGNIICEIVPRLCGFSIFYFFQELFSLYLPSFGLPLWLGFIDGIYLNVKLGVDRLVLFKVKSGYAFLSYYK